MIHKPICDDLAVTSRDRLEVRTLRCGRNNPGSNPGHGTFLFCFYKGCNHVGLLEDGYLKFFCVWNGFPVNIAANKKIICLQAGLAIVNGTRNRKF